MAEHNHNHDEGSNLSEMDLRVRALETILVEKGYIETAALDRIVELYETKIGPHIGAQIIAKAWTDPGFRQSLLDDASKAAGALTEVGRVGDHLIAVENTPQVHNMIVCTLCSCYPTDVLGLPPTWYKSFAYRSRLVKEPRAVLADFGVALPAETEIRVALALGAAAARDTVSRAGANPPGRQLRRGQEHPGSPSRTDVRRAVWRAHPARARTPGCRR